VGLEDDPFDYELTKSGNVRVFRGGRVVVTVSGAAAWKLVARLGTGAKQDQHLLARVTGNYKRGNERRPIRGGRPD